MAQKKSILQLIALKKEKIIRLSLGLILVWGISSLFFIKLELVATWVSVLENIGYDIEVRQMHKPLGKNGSVAIVDIDDKSLEAEGRWPWPRDKFAKLVTNLYKNGATVLAFDVTFPDKEENIAEEVPSLKIKRRQLVHCLRRS
jgi:adenylate cyclase